MISALPANQVALAHTIKTLAKGRRKTMKQHLITAEELMVALRGRGFRLVPFPPLKAQAKRAKKAARKATR